MRCVVSRGSTSFPLHSSLEFCCEGPWFTRIQEDGCDKRAQLISRYLGAERNTRINRWNDSCRPVVLFSGEETGQAWKAVAPAVLGLPVPAESVHPCCLVGVISVKEPFHLIKEPLVNRASWRSRQLWRTPKASPAKGRHVLRGGKYNF